MQRLHSHAFYLYGVIAGLSIREVLVRTGPDLFLFLSSKTELWKVHLEWIRLIVFFLAISCFYFGAGVFFDRVHVDPKTAQAYKKKNYGLDFWFGLIHFLIFFAWALTINDYSRTTSGLSLFWIFLAAIFLYDSAWLLANFRYDTFQEIKLWAEICGAVVFLAGVVSIFFKFVLLKDAVVAEEASFCVFIVYLLLDLAELFTGNSIFSEWLKRLVPRNTLSPAGTSSTTQPALQDNDVEGPPSQD